MCDRGCDNDSRGRKDAFHSVWRLCESAVRNAGEALLKVNGAKMFNLRPVWI